MAKNGDMKSILNIETNGDIGPKIILVHERWIIQNTQHFSSPEEALGQALKMADNLGLDVRCKCENPCLLGNEDTNLIPKGYARCQNLGCRGWAKV